MRLPDAKIENAVGPKPFRYTVGAKPSRYNTWHAVRLDVEGKRMLATDECILAVVPCEVSDGDSSALIGLDAIKQIRAMQKRAKGIPVEVHINGKCNVTGVGESAEFELVEGEFPNADALVKRVKFNGPATITLNVDLLMRLAKAIGSEHPTTGQHIVSLYVKDANSGILVKTSNNPGALGVIGPYRPPRRAGAEAES